MPKYLMLSHLGVLAGEKNNIHPEHNDLVLQEYDDGDKQVLRKGVLIVNQLNALVQHYGYEIVFHSQNSIQQQLALLGQLRKACENKGIEFPPVVAMATIDRSITETSANPRKTEVEGILVASYGVEKDGNAGVREALLKVLNIKEEEREETIRQSIVFAYNPKVVKQAQAEGYQAVDIEGIDNKTLHEAMSDVMQAAMQQEEERCQAKAAAQRYDVTYSYGAQDQNGKQLKELGRGHSQKLTPDEVNLMFLGIMEELDELSTAKKSCYFNFELRWAGVNGSSEAKVFNNRHECAWFLSQRTKLLLPNEVFVGEVSPSTIQEAHRQILQMTKQYKQEHEQARTGKPDPKLDTKIKIFEELQTLLQDSRETKYKRLENFARQLQLKDADLKEHRTAKWKRYVSNVLSILTVLPGVARALHSYYKYGTFRFWKPGSERVKDFALRQGAKLNINISFRT